VADLSRAVAILISSGRDWTDRTKRLLARAPDLDIFGQSLVIRDVQGWRITDAGRSFLTSIENPVAPPAPAPAPTVPVLPVATAPSSPLIGINTRRPRRRRRRARNLPRASVV
jgi:hypothetical protein